MNQQWPQIQRRYKDPEDEGDSEGGCQGLARMMNFHNIIDGVDVDKVADPGSVSHGNWMRNGWKNCGAPWTDEVNPEQTCMLSVKRQEKSGWEEFNIIFR